MAKQVRQVGLVLYALAVVAGLGFGATALRAQPRETCPDDGWQYLGACSSEQDCDDRCNLVHGGSAGGKCLGGCCECYIR